MSKDYRKTLRQQLDLNWDGVEELDESEVPSAPQAKPSVQVPDVSEREESK